MPTTYLPTPEEIAAETAKFRKKRRAKEKREESNRRRQYRNRLIKKRLRDMGREDVCNVEFVSDSELAEFFGDIDDRWCVAEGKGVE